MEVIIRPATAADAEALAHALISANEAAFRGAIPDQCLDFTEAESASNWRRTFEQELAAGVFLDVVEAASERAGVVAYAMGGPRPDPVYPGELKQLIVLPSHQRQGIGRMLVSQVAGRLACEQGIYAMCVEALRCNPHRAFYERLGAELVSERPHDWDGVFLPMYLYGWKDTQGLIGGGR